MTVLLGNHIGHKVRPHDEPGVSWKVDAVVDIHCDHDLIRAHDETGGEHFLLADEAVFIEETR